MEWIRRYENPVIQILYILLLKKIKDVFHLYKLDYLDINQFTLKEKVIDKMKEKG